MKMIIMAALLVSTFLAMAGDKDKDGPSYYDSEYGDHSNYTGRYIAPPQGLYFTPERLDAIKQLEAINESNDLVRQQMLQRQLHGDQN